MPTCAIASTREKRASTCTIADAAGDALRLRSGGCGGVEAADITAGGGIVLTSGVGAAPTFCNLAQRVIVELNRHHPAAILGMHDIYEPADPPYRKQIPIYKPSDRIGSPIISIDPAKIVGVVETNLEDEARGFSEISPLDRIHRPQCRRVSGAQLAAGMIPKPFLPIQSGVGDIANSVLGALGSHKGIPPFEMYTEVLQDSVVDLLERGRVTFASSCSFTVTPPALKRVYGNSSSSARAWCCGRRRSATVRKSSGGWVSSRSTRPSKSIFSGTSTART